MIEYLRAVVLAPDRGLGARCHAIFVDAQRCYLGDAACGMGSAGRCPLSDAGNFRGPRLRLSVRAG